MQPDSPLRATIVVGGVFALGLGLGSMTGAAAAARAQDPYADLDLFARVLTTVERDYVEEVPTRRLVDAAVRGMMDELDRHSIWLSSDQLRALVDETDGAITGVGIEVRPAGDAVEIVRVLPDSPALRGGLAPGDKLLEIDGHPVGALPPDEIAALLRGERGEAAVLTVLRDGWDAPREVRTVRDRVHRPTAEGALVGPTLAYARLESFQGGAAAELLLEIQRLAENAGGPLTGLVLDLRDNPGGLLTEAVAVTDLFLDDGPIVSTRRRVGDGQDEVHVATPGGLPASLGVVVLVNGGSASASEIVAAALQETGRAVLVGEPTYGKGTVQQVYRHLVEDTSALKLTVGRYYTPSGEPVATGEGRTPDHVVRYPRVQGPREQLRDRITALDDPARDELLALVDALPAPPSAPIAIAWDAPIADRVAHDPQLQRAVALLSER